MEGNGKVYEKNTNLLNHQETLELIKKAQNGDKMAVEKLVEFNLGLVRSIVKKFQNRGYDREDLFQLGSIGLIKAIQNFDISYEVRFSTYAVPMIMGEIKRFLRDDGMIKVSRSLKETYQKVYCVKEKLSKKLQREPTLDEISKELEIDKEEITMALEAGYNPEYLYDTIHQDDGSPILLIDKISDEKSEDLNVEDRITLKEMISKLEPRERQIVVMRYFQDKTQTQIANKLGISQVQVSRIEKKILTRMRESMKN
ncbi:RNA polymerase sporulation sigma factor SigF [Garciella nitratireducens]|uniref:RNA polymerase sigma factor n=1 Tax=Garciella nitratireducens DSM 15102 TaxID=1121911 RepID=A0A1T4K226_9FIRM|nr:RNA polymerase sporulation sigma factor SigF [Garciella nitratireducens]RBP46627.1 RNA polymerase sigma (RpoX/SigF) subunit [Garciella nitratireducens]SJZ36522.1 RNA polymerase, sigma subunit, RpoX/SigF [Garciella nitratireducens DSM 15102]